VLGSDALPCGFGEEPVEGRERFRVVRAGESLVFERGERSERCEGPSGALPLGLRAHGEESVVTHLSVVRRAP